MPLEIRTATSDDVPAILEIHSEIIRNSTAIYLLVPNTLEERSAWFTARVGDGYPVIVAHEGHEICGYASFGEFRGALGGYRHSVEHTVHVRADKRGHGVGRALLEALVPLAQKMRKHVMVGAIDAENAISLRLHERLGFKQVAHFREVGHKFDRWLDLVFVQLILEDQKMDRRAATHEV